MRWKLSKLRSISLVAILFLLSSATPTKWFFVLHARASTISEGTLHLYGTSDLLTGFSEAPKRKTTTLHLDHFIQNWNEFFDSQDPSAAVVFANPHGAIDEHIVILRRPRIDRGDLVFDIESVKGPITGTFGPTLLYIGDSDTIETLPKERPD